MTVTTSTLGHRLAQYLDLRRVPALEEFFLREYPLDVAANPTLSDEGVSQLLQGRPRAQLLFALLSSHVLRGTQRALLVTKEKRSTVLLHFVATQDLREDEIAAILRRSHVPALSSSLVRQANERGLTKETRRLALRDATREITMSALCASQEGEYLDDAERWITNYLVQKGYRNLDVLALLLVQRPDLVTTVLNLVSLGTPVLRSLLLFSGLVRDPQRQLDLLGLGWTRTCESTSAEFVCRLNDEAYTLCRSFGVLSPFLDTSVLGVLSHVLSRIKNADPARVRLVSALHGARTHESRTGDVADAERVRQWMECAQVTRLARPDRTVAWPAILLSRFSDELRASTPTLGSRWTYERDRVAALVRQWRAPGSPRTTRAADLVAAYVARLDAPPPEDVVTNAPRLGDLLTMPVLPDSRRPYPLLWLESMMPPRAEAYQLLLALAPTWEGSAASLVETASLLS